MVNQRFSSGCTVAAKDGRAAIVIALEKERADRAADALEADIAGGGFSGSLRLWGDAGHVRR